MRTSVTTVLALVLPSIVASFQYNIPYYVKPRPAFSLISLQSTSTSTSSSSSSSSSCSNTVDDTTSPSSSRLTLSSPSTGKRLKRDRYVATNRFAIRRGKGAKFEKRWATRKSRLASLPGFRYFHLMRRVSLDDDDKNSSSFLGNYVSFTVWETLGDFARWRSGEAFKEAHGGTSIGAFLSTMLSSARVMTGAPRPAFYDALLQTSAVPDVVPPTVDGWRDDVAADGITLLPAECFVTCEQFYVEREHGVAFEQQQQQHGDVQQQHGDDARPRKDVEGFVSYALMRRDVRAKGHNVKPRRDDEPTYVGTTVWKDRECYRKWSESDSFQQADNANDDETIAKAEVDAPLWTKPPVLIFYEGALVITCKEGA